MLEAFDLEITVDDPPVPEPAVVAGHQVTSPGVGGSENVNYYVKLLPEERANHYLNCLLSTIDWRNDETVIFGKKIMTKRQVA